MAMLNNQRVIAWWIFPWQTVSHNQMLIWQGIMAATTFPVMPVTGHEGSMGSMMVTYPSRRQKVTPRHSAKLQKFLGSNIAKASLKL